MIDQLTFGEKCIDFCIKLLVFENKSSVALIFVKLLFLMSGGSHVFCNSFCKYVMLIKSDLAFSSELFCVFLALL